MKKYIHNVFTIIFFAACAAMGITSCSDDKTYAELLTTENHAVNAYLADQTVVNQVPADSIFVAGIDAPFYRMDPDGQVYMQVVNPGTPGNKVKADETIYFRYHRYNLNHYSNGKLPEGTGNDTDLSEGNAFFRYGNYALESTMQWGSGVQLPLAYLPVDCEVNVIIKSQYGFMKEMADVIPYLYNIYYYRPKI